MNIELIEFLHDLTVRFKVNQDEYQCNLDGFNITDLSKDVLSNNFYDYQVQHIEQELKRQMSPDFKQARYTDEKGQDLIDIWADRHTIEEFRVIMWAMIEKYQRRLGKKDTIAQDVGKIADYARRWAQVEREVDMD